MLCSQSTATLHHIMTNLCKQKFLAVSSYLQCLISQKIGSRRRDSERCLLVWTRLWNFIERQVKFNALLHPNEHPERICSYLVRQFEAELAKIGHFQISKSIFEAKYDSIFLKPKFLFEYQIRRTTLLQVSFFSYFASIIDFEI